MGQSGSVPYTRGYSRPYFNIRSMIRAVPEGTG